MKVFALVALAAATFTSFAMADDGGLPACAEPDGVACAEVGEADCASSFVVNGCPETCGACTVTTSTTTTTTTTLPAGAADQPKITACMTDYAQTKDTNECNTLITLAKCFAIAGVNDLAGSDAMRTMADDFLLGQQNKASYQTKCANYEQISAPAFRVERGALELDLDGEKNVNFNRLRRTTVSLFGLHAQISDLESAVDGLPAKIDAVKAVADGITTTADKSAAKLAGDLLKIQSDISRMTNAKDLTSDINVQFSSGSGDRANLKSDILNNINTAVSQTNSENANALSLASVKIDGKFSTLLTAVAGLGPKADRVLLDAKALPAGGIVGWKQCEKVGANGADSYTFVAMECTYIKKQADTRMHISINSDQRQINGWSRWELQVSTGASGGWRDCHGPGNDWKGRIYTRYHGSRGVNLHRPQYLGGICYQTNNNQAIPAGQVKMRYIQKSLSSDSYWNWESSAKMIMEERKSYF